MCSWSVNALFRCSAAGDLNLHKFLKWPHSQRDGRTKYVVQVLMSITYNYIRNTCLHMVLRLGCSSLFFGQSWCNSVNCPTVICSPSTLFFAWRDTTSETLNPGPSFTFIAFVVTFTFLAAPTTWLLLCGVGDSGSLKGYTRQHTVATYILSSTFSSVIELQLNC